MVCVGGVLDSLITVEDQAIGDLFVLFGLLKSTGNQDN